MDNDRAMERSLREQLHSSLLTAQRVLSDSPDAIDDAQSGDDGETAFAELARAVAEIAAAVTELRGLPTVSREGALVAGSADVAAAVLRTTLATMAASLDARSEAA